MFGSARTRRRGWAVAVALGAGALLWLGERGVAQRGMTPLFDRAACDLLVAWLADAKGPPPEAKAVTYPDGPWTVLAIAGGADAGGKPLPSVQATGSGAARAALAQAGRSLAAKTAPGAATWLGLRFAPGTAAAALPASPTWGCFRDDSTPPGGALPTFRDHAFLDHALGARGDRPTIDAALAGAARYLLAAEKNDGSFAYEYRAATGDETDGYNVLRHAGTVTAMLDLSQARGDQALRAAAGPALAWLRRQIQGCPPPTPDARCVVEDGDIKLGGNALAAIALARWATMTGSKGDLPAIRALARRILGLEERSGRLTGHKQNAASGKFADFTSSYYPGEAILALLRVNALAPSPDLVDGAARAARYLVEVRDKNKAQSELEHDHWLLYALRELYEVQPAPWIPAHARRLVQAIAAAQNVAAALPLDWRGSWYEAPRSAPAATRIEGLMAAYTLLMKAGDRRGASLALDTARLASTYLVATQVGPAAAIYLKEPLRALGGFRAALDEPTIRIDFVQHAVSALLQLRAAAE